MEPPGPVKTSSPSQVIPPSSHVIMSQSASPSHKDSWVSMVQGNAKSIENFQPDFEVVNGVAKVKIPEEVMGDSNPLWKCFVVGYFMGEAPYVGSIHATVNRIWTVLEKSTKIDVQFINKTTVLIRIESDRIHEHVLKRKYWHIANVPLVIREWNPATAHAPPDLSAMPLWVDLKDVPAHLYSHEERCIRLDMARILVEVNLQKPLVELICFPDTNGEDVRVSVSYLWLPPRCNICSKWGHLGKDCTRKVSILSDQNLSKKSEGNSRTDNKSGKVISVQELAQELLKDLENSAPLGAQISPANAPEKTVTETEQTVQQSTETQWTEVTRKGHSSPLRQDNKPQKLNGTVSPNGFGILQNLDEDGGVAESIPDPKLAEGSQAETCEEGEIKESEGEEEDMTADPETMKTITVKHKEGNTKHRSRSRGPPRPIVNRKEGGKAKHTSSWK
ncbi:unnamed protein product [Arabidopsis arenosa]|uniref:DUF4283 domain-containing protein n=1 Tax=Arabidopsis arenosa TaxID=38785 RepID=A0A8S2A342_ARAAE|nr:unnamed protein product [Arabidopsis arenosa]